MDSGARTPFHPMTAAADWGERLSSVRLSEPVDETAANSERLERCHRQFREISQRTRNLWKRAEFHPDSVPRIARLGQESLSLSRMICDELIAHTVNAGIFLPVPMDVLEDLLAANETMLDWLTDRMDATATFSPVATRLKHIVEGIVSGKEHSSRSVRALSAEFVFAVRHCPELSFQTAADAGAHFEIMTPIGDGRGGWFAQSLLAAWFLSRTTSQNGTPSEVDQRLTMAALMQDLGGWTEAARLSLRQNDPHGIVPRLPPYHPSTGAAMLSGLADTPAEVTLLVGAHHERCDGSGFPQRLSGSQLSFATQRLTWAVRFAELILDPLTAASAIESGDAVDTIAGVRLWREVARGAFDQQATRDWLQAIRHGLTEEVLALFPKHQLRFVDQPHRSIPLPHVQGLEVAKPAEQPQGEGIPEPQFLRRGRRVTSNIGQMARYQREGRPS
ncbi:MAG: HD domain-containing phosphohydrolase [Planctomycetaceae bacterium]|nr:HD domain-containing phosphohydrolase [Planctomycetaceae bacterium]